MPTLFEVQTLDTATGAESWMPVEASSVDEAKARAMVAGKAVGDARPVAVVHAPPLRRRAWFGSIGTGIGIGIGVAIAIIAACVIFVWISQPDPTRQTPLVVFGSTPEQLAEAPFPAKGKYRHRVVISDRYDKFDNWSTRSIDVGSGERSLGLFVLFEGKQLTKTPSTVALSLPDGADSVAILADGVRVEVDESSFGTHSIATHDFVRMANAAAVDVRVGWKEFRITPEEQQALRDFASRLTP